jgi:hypothetical protein
MIESSKPLVPPISRAWRERWGQHPDLEKFVLTETCFAFCCVTLDPRDRVQDIAEPFAVVSYGSSLFCVGRHSRPCAPEDRPSGDGFGKA